MPQPVNAGAFDHVSEWSKALHVWEKTMDDSVAAGWGGGEGDAFLDKRPCGRRGGNAVCSPAPVIILSC